MYMRFMFQSLSDEDSFKKISSTKDVMEKIQELLNNLVQRLVSFVLLWSCVFVIWLYDLM